ncbi:MAG: hypothetical protein AAF483_29900, partial [Planctomycetota bacterium]
MSRSFFKQYASTKQSFRSAITRRYLVLEQLEAKMLLAADMDGASMPDGAMDHAAMVGSSLMNHNSHGGTAGMSGDASMQHQGHTAAMNLVPLSSVTNEVVQTGNWADPATWSNNEVPTSGARILVPQGLSVT